MSEKPTMDANKPHWAIPHVVGVLMAVAVYIAIYAFTGDSDLLIFMISLTSGAATLAGTWFYLFVHLPRRSK